MISRLLFYFFLSSFFYQSYSQVVGTTDKKAQKLFDKGKEYVAERNFLEAVESFKKAIKRDSGYSEAYYNLASIYTLYRIQDTTFIYLDLYAKVTPMTAIPVNRALVLARNYFQYGMYQQAGKYIDYAYDSNKQLFVSFNNSLLKQSIEYSIDNYQENKSEQFQILPESVNKYYTQYFPAITIDNSSLVYTKRDGYDPGFDEDLVITNWNGKNWTESTELSENIDSQNNEGAATISADGRMLIFTSCDEGKTFGSCDLFFAKKKGMTWSIPYNMGDAVNSVYWESQPSLSADGKTLYFSSNRPGGNGLRDIWYTEQKNGYWTKPKNLGRKINTPADETTPYIHVNNQSLFFSSNGHVGFGGYDLYVTEKSAGEWSKPTNLGSEVNDFHDQVSWVLTADGSLAYYAYESTTEDKGRSYIVSKEIENDSIINKTAAYVTGRIRDSKTKKPLKANIKLYDLETSNVDYNTESDIISGLYFIALTEGKEYGFYISSPGYVFEDFHFEPKEREGLQPDTLNVFLDPIEKGKSMVLENIYFKFDSYELEIKSRSELIEVADFINENGLYVLIEGHTDQMGTDEYNVELSNNRARSVYNYLIDLGVSKDQLRYKGYGSKRPLFQTKDKYSANRRIEFKIVDKKS